MGSGGREAERPRAPPDHPCCSHAFARFGGCLEGVWLTATQLPSLGTLPRPRPDSRSRNCDPEAPGGLLSVSPLPLCRRRCHHCSVLAMLAEGSNGSPSRLSVPISPRHPNPSLLGPHLPKPQGGEGGSASRSPRRSSREQAPDLRLRSSKGGLCKDRPGSPEWEGGGALSTRLPRRPCSSAPGPVPCSAVSLHPPPSFPCLCKRHFSLPGLD